MPTTIVFDNPEPDMVVGPTFTAYGRYTVQYTIVGTPLVPESKPQPNQRSVLPEPRVVPGPLSRGAEPVEEMETEFVQSSPAVTQTNYRIVCTLQPQGGTESSEIEATWELDQVTLSGTWQCSLVTGFTPALTVRAKIMVGTSTISSAQVVVSCPANPWIKVESPPEEPEGGDPKAIGRINPEQILETYLTAVQGDPKKADPKADPKVPAKKKGKVKRKYTAKGKYSPRGPNTHYVEVRLFRKGKQRGRPHTPLLIPAETAWENYVEANDSDLGAGHVVSVRLLYNSKWVATASTATFELADPPKKK